MDHNKQYKKKARIRRNLIILGKNDIFIPCSTSSNAIIQKTKNYYTSCKNYTLHKFLKLKTSVHCNFYIKNQNTSLWL